MNASTSSMQTIQPNKVRNHTPHTVNARCELANRLAAADLNYIYLSYDEVATLAGIQVTKIESLCQAGKGPKSSRLGYRTVRFNAAEVIRWLQTL